MLDQNTHEALHRSERRPVDHDGAVRVVVLTDIFELKPLRQIVIKLHRAELPLAANAVADHEIDFRTIEGRFPLLSRVVHAQALHNLEEDPLRGIPILFRADVLAATGRTEADAYPIVI